MADIYKLKPHILRWEGGFVNDPLDHGGATNKGVTLSTFRFYFGSNKTVGDLRNISDSEWLYVLKHGFWDQWKADLINNQSIANILVDFAWASGAKTSIKKIQRILYLTPDGVVGPKTLAALNGPNKQEIFEKIKAERLRYVDAICRANMTQLRFLRGWQNRINYYTFQP